MKAKSRFFTLIAVASLLVLLFCTPAVTVYAETPVDAFAEEVDQLPDAEEPAPSAPTDEPTEGVTEEGVVVGETYTFSDSGGEYSVVIISLSEYSLHAQNGSEEFYYTGTYSYDNGLLVLFALGETLGSFYIDGNTLISSESPAEEPTTGPETPTEDELSDAVQQFIDGLKEQYGQEWMTYYNAIIAEWGTVENYLMSLLPDDSPDVVKDAWLAFVAWTRDNWTILAAIGATIAACAGVVLYVALKRKANAFMQKKFNNIYDEYNKQSAAIKAQNAMLIAMSGSNPRFEEQRNALKATADALDEASEEK